MRRLRASREVRGRADDDEPQVAGDRHGDHVPVDHLAESDPGIVALGDDVERLVAHEEVDRDVRMRRQEAGEKRAGQERLGGPGHVQPERTPRLGGHLPTAATAARSSLSAAGRAAA